MDLNCTRSSTQPAKPIMLEERASRKSKCDELRVDCWIPRILVQYRTVWVTWAFVPWAEDHIHAGKSDVAEGFVVVAFVVEAFVVEGFRNYTVVVCRNFHGIPTP